MLQEINADLLAQMGTAQIEEETVEKILEALYEAMPSQANGDYHRLFAANRLSKANKKVLDGLKKTVFDLMRNPKGFESVTKTIGACMFKLYYTTASNWSKVHLPELTEEQRAKMSPKEIELEASKRDTLDDWHALNDEISASEALLKPMKEQLAGLTKALEALMPTSKCIKHTPVIQVTQVAME